MTPNELRAALVKRYGEASNYRLAVSFAADYGVQWRAVQRWLRGQRKIPRPAIKRLVDAKVVSTRALAPDIPAKP